MNKEEAKKNFNESQKLMYGLVESTIGNCYISGADSYDILDVLAILHDEWIDVINKEEEGLV
ncbi:hypothetical protein ABZ714_14305 [Streptomyces sp. NPDC006798]|uniref:hypothetical protein n=1 Tax=unclassified Streptomyces TaxID=2593676 RepID=UPI0033DE34B5